MGGRELRPINRRRSRAEQTHCQYCRDTWLVETSNVNVSKRCLIQADACEWPFSWRLLSHVTSRIEMSFRRQTHNTHVREG